MPGLDHDIRRLPPLSRNSSGRVPKNKSSPEQASTGNTSLSANSTGKGFSSSGRSALRGESSATSAPDALEASPISPFKKKRRQPKRHVDSRKLSKNLPRQQRYWNEFDDGSEGDQPEAYAIYVDPEAPTQFPGAAAVSNFCRLVAEHTKASTEKMTSWMKGTKAADREQESLINGIHSSPDDSDFSDNGTSEVTQTPRRYSTFPSHAQHTRNEAQEKHLFRSCLLSFAASIILLIVAAILVTTGRQKVAAEVDLGVVIGVAASLVFAIIGLGSLLARRAHLGWVHRVIVLLVFLGVMLVSVALLVALSRPVR